MSGNRPTKPANLALQDPPLINLVTFLTLVQREMKANASKQINDVSPALGGPTRQQIATVKEICEAAVSRSGRFDYFDSTQGTNPQNRVSDRQGPWVTVAQMNKLVEASLYNNKAPAAYDLDDLRDGLRDFKSKWETLDPDAVRPNTVTNAVPNTYERAHRAVDFVNSLPNLGPSTTQSKPTVRVLDNNGGRVDAGYGAISTCEFVKEALFPFTDETPLSADEKARQSEVNSHPLEAFKLVVKAAAEAGTTSMNPTATDVKPVDFMVNRFVRPDVTRSDIFEAMDPKKAPGT